MGELEHIGDEVHKQLRRLQDQDPAGDQDIWSEADEAELQQEIQAIFFNPSLSNPNYPDRSVTVQGRKEPIHFVNNFPMILVVMDKVRHGQEPPPERSFEAIYAAVAAERKYVEIFDRMESNYPALYKKIRLMEGQKEAHALERSEEARNLRDYHKSKAFAAAAGIAYQLDPGYDMTLLNP